MSLCIVIPTYNRPTEFERTIVSLGRQTVKPDQIIIVDDGSPPDALAHMRKVVSSVKVPIRLIENKPQKGPASARNKGIQHSKEDLILMMNDDTIPENDRFIETHLKFVSDFPDCIILGNLKWHPETPNKFLNNSWVKKLGIDVGYDDIGDKDIVGFNKFCTANVLVPRKFLSSCRFDEKFPYAALEDTELGYRLYKEGVPIRYNPSSCVLHLHSYTKEMLIKRQEKIGESLVYLLKSHPELSGQFMPKISKRMSLLLYRFISTPLKNLLPQYLFLFLLGLLSKYKAFAENH